MLEFLSIVSLNLPAALCLVVGVLLLGIEIFLPGFGVSGISGLILVIIGIVLGASSLLEALILILVILAVLGVLVEIAMRSATRGRLSKTPLILKDELDKESGFSSARDREYFIGREGVTLTPLRPAGLADFDGVKLDVVSDAGFLDKDTRIKVIDVEGRRIAVRRITE